MTDVDHAPSTIDEPARRGVNTHTVLAIGLPSALLAWTYLSLAELGVTASTVGVGMVALTLALGVAAYKGTKAGHAAGYVAAAVVLPLAMMYALTLGVLGKVEAGVEDLFDGGTSTSDVEEGEPLEPLPITDANGDGLADDMWADTDCVSVFGTGEYADDQLVAECYANGGY